MAFRATRHVMGALQKERNDIQLALKKTWKVHQHTDGLVTRSISPYQVDLYTSWFKSMPMKLKHRWIETGPECLLALLTLGIVPFSKIECEWNELATRD